MHLKEGQTLNDVQGYNFVGLLPGKNWGTPEDKVVVLGAVRIHNYSRYHSSQPIH